MKTYIKKPVVWLVAAVIVGGGLTPVWAENGTMSKLLASDIAPAADRTDAGLSGVEQVTNANGTYIKANVRDDVTKVIILFPDNSKSEIASFPNHGLTVAIPASATQDEKTATLLAYVGTELVDTVKIKLSDGTISKDELVYANALYDQTAKTMKVSGLVNPKVDKVVVRYKTTAATAKLATAWEGAKSFEYGFSTPDVDADVTVELYAGENKLSEQTVKVVKINAPAAEKPKPSATIKGSAVLSANSKQVEVKGTITFQNKGKDSEWKLVVTTPDGKKHEIKLAANGTFDAKLSFQNRSFSAKSVHVELYNGKTLVTKTDIAHGTPVNTPTPKKPENPVKLVHVDKAELEKKKAELEKNKDKLKEYWTQVAQKNGEKQWEKAHKEHKDSDHGCKN